MAPKKSYFGKDFTPKGDVHFLVVFAGFEGSEFVPIGDESDPSSWGADQFPNWYQNEGNNLRKVLFEENSDFTNYPNEINASNLYNIQSHPNEDFKITGEVFSDENGPVFITLSTQEQMQVASNSWTSLNNIVVQKMDNYATANNFPSNYFDKFNKQGSTPNFNYDASNSSPDNKIDFIVFIYKYQANVTQDYQFLNMNNFPGISGGVTAGAPSTPLGPYIAQNGFSLAAASGLYGIRRTFMHELAHQMYSAPHIFDTNNILGRYFNNQSFGRGIMGQVEMDESMTAWARWYLDWITPTEPVSNGVYEISDLYSTGDAIRIEIPNTNGNEHLWIEYHEDENNPLYHHRWQNTNMGPGNINTTDSEQGLHIYTDNIAGSHEHVNVVVSGANGIHYLHPDGNYDWNIEGDYVENNWGNKLYPFTHNRENPISGTNVFQNHKWDSNGDGHIELTDGYNSGSSTERSNKLRELDSNGNDHYWYRGYGYAVPDEKSTWEVNDVINIGSNPNIVNVSKYSKGNHKSGRIFLNGLSVKVISLGATAKIEVKFKETNLDNDVFWSGEDVALPNITEDGNPDLIVNKNVKLTIGKSGTANRHTPYQGEFINPTVFTCLSDSYVLQTENSTVEIKDNESLMQMQPSSTYEIQPNADLIVKAGSTFEVMDCATLIIQKEGRLIVENGGILKIHPNANIKLYEGAANIVLQAGSVIPPGFITPSNSYPSSLTISSNTNWTNVDNFIMSDVVVETGNVLTIDNSTLKLADEVRIIVERGAKLIIDGSHLTNLSSCPEDTQYWRGIVVNGNSNKIQPDPLSTTPLAPDDAGVVIVKNHSIIEYARDAIVTNYSGDFTVDNWGGVIYAEYSTFTNNRRAFAFMKYEYPNKSKIIGCQIDSGNFTGGNSYGATVWACSDIVFEQNNFELLSNGLFGADYSLIVRNGNNFVNCDYGIRAMSSIPLATNLEVDGSEEMNYFANNQIDILWSASSGGAGLRIHDNEFFNSYASIMLIGDSNYKINNNSFYDMDYAIYTAKTGFFPNKISCNTLQNTKRGVFVTGDNSGLVILSNNFISDNIRDINLDADAGFGIAEIREFQGSSGQPANNCFDQDFYDIKTGISQHFYYFYPPAVVDDDCHIPEDNLSDGGVNNYTLIQTDPTTDSECGNSNNETNNVFTITDLNNVKSELTNISALLSDTPSDIGLKSERSELLIEKETILNSIVTNAMSNDDFSTVEDVLTGESDFKYKTWGYKAKLLQNDFVQAQQKLNSLENTNPSDGEYLFLEAQNINLDRVYKLNQGNKKVLTIDEENELTELATSDSYMQGYAQALLFILQDKSFDINIPVIDEESDKIVTRGNINDSSFTNFKDIKVYPNPLSDFLFVNLDKDQVGQQISIRIVDINGKEVYASKIKYESEYILNTSSIKGGIYYISIQNNEQILYNDKLVVVK